ncbi:MAG: response regulator, partial [Desulfofustis sp. PB-SRB1]|nr:response regulator [Desulfofustis sp. PB-SRB1]
LLVDDEKDFANTLAERINMRELSSSVALDGEEALELVSNEVPDVMVLDLRMPGIDGIEVLKRVRKTYPKVQVIVLTGKGTEQDEKEVRKLGAFEYLEKPIEVDTLVDKIRRAYSATVESSLMAGVFAEAGEFDTAKEIMDQEEKKNSLLFESVMALEKAHCNERGPSYKYRALLVTDGAGRVIGKLDHISVLHALEPEFQDIGDISMLTRHGLGPSFVRNITRDFDLLQKPLDDICKKAGKLTVRKIMHIPAKSEYIGQGATLNEGIHQLVLGRHQSLLVENGDRVVGVLRLSDVYHYILEVMQKCDIT